MKLNIDETLAMHIGINQKHHITINNQEITATTSYKYLGTHLNTELDWDAQWDFIIKKFRNTIYLVKTLKNLCFKKEILVTIYKSLVLSQIISNVITLCSTSKRVGDEMVNLQKRMLKKIGTVDPRLSRPTFIETRDFYKDFSHLDHK